MVGSAVATIVWSSAAMSMPSRTARKMKFRRFGSTATLSGADSAAGLAAIASGVALVMPAFPSASDPYGCPPLTGGNRQIMRSWRADRPRRGRASARGPGDALRRVQLLAQLVHQLQLRLEVVDVLFLIGHDLFQEDGAGAVLLFATQDDAGLEPLHHLVFDGQVGLELLTQRLADAHREQALV